MTVVVLCGAMAIACGEEPQDDTASDETQAIMRVIFDEIRRLLPLGVDAKRLASPEQQPQVARSIDTLARNAHLLEEHSARKDPQMRFLARSIARDARHLGRTYAQGRYERSAFLLRQITENCVVCHTRLPSDEDSLLARGFVDQTAFDAMELEPRAALQMATRRFDDALETLEALLASPRSPALLLGPLTDYLVISLRVKGDFQRPIEPLRRFAARQDLWDELRSDVEIWSEVLPRLEKQTAGEPSLATARTLLDEGRSMVTFPQDRAWLAHFVAASSVLQRLLFDTPPKPGPELAEAYYLLGITEARIGRNYWVTAAPFLLETSIRMAPDQPFAREALALLEQELLMSYEGSDFENIPAEERAELDELKALMN
jgi:hypothetical protein